MGKAAVLLVIGTIALFLYTSKDLAGSGVDAINNVVSNYEAGVVRNIAVAGANYGANYLFQYPPNMNGNAWWTGTGNDVVFSGGKFRVRLDSTSSYDSIAHERRLTMVSTGYYKSSTYQVKVILHPSCFSKFAIYTGVTGSSNARWETGDSCWGPFHAEGTLKTSGRPWFGGKVTTKNGIDSSGGAHPIFNAGLETGVSVAFNKNYQKTAASAVSGGKVSNGSSGDLYLTFCGDSVKYHRGTSATTPADTTVLASVFSPNGAILNKKGNTYIKGVVKGRYTVASLDSVTSGAGKTIIMDNLTYSSDPTVNPNSTDMFGVVSWNNVVIKDNGSALFKIMGSFMSYKGSWEVENYSTRNPGILYTLGGWIVESVNATSNGVPLGQSGAKGYKMGVHYDERFRYSSPPSYPGTNAYEILAWYE